MPPFFSQLPMGWISDESTRRQKSFLLSLPSSRRRRRAPVSPTTVAMQVDVVLRGSCASSFMPALNSFTGGVVLCRERCGEDGEKNPENQRHKEEATHTHTYTHTHVLSSPSFCSTFEYCLHFDVYLFFSHVRGHWRESSL